MSETFCMMGTSLHIKNMQIQQFCDCKIRDFVIMALRARKDFRGFQEAGPWAMLFKA